MTVIFIVFYMVSPHKIGAETRERRSQEQTIIGTH